MTPKQYLFMIYALYASVLFGLFFVPVAGVVAAYVKRSDMQADPLLRSHNEYLIRTFWVSLAANLAGWLLTVIFIGWLVLAAWLLWLIYRLVKGAVMLNDNRAVNPTAWI